MMRQYIRDMDDIEMFMETNYQWPSEWCGDGVISFHTRATGWYLFCISNHGILRQGDISDPEIDVDELYKYAKIIGVDDNL